MEKDIFCAKQHQYPHENFKVTQINRERAHAKLCSYPTFLSAKNFDTSANIVSLDGEWQLHYVNRWEQLPEDFFNADLDYKSITVPSNLELNGFGKPVYTNNLYPFKGSKTEKYLINPKSDGNNSDFERYNPPFIPNENAVGVYKKTFEINDCSSNVFIHFDGVEASFYLYINGEFVGYSEDSKLPSEFDITDAVIAGENTIVVAVLRFCSGTWLEDQDYFHLSGIYRSVHILHKPKHYISDYFVKAAPNGDGGMINAKCYVNRTDGFADCSVKLDLFDKSGAAVLTQTRHIDIETPILGMGSGSFLCENARPESECATFNITVDTVKKWSCDNPYLYTAVFTLVDKSGNEIDFESVKIGFRSIAIENNIIKLNGKRVIFRGVNRHEFAYPTGRTVSTQHMKSEIMLMKQLNFNAVRTCHYPDDPRWYDLCDEYGILVVCEANIETHGIGGRITNNPQWSEEMLTRGVRMVLTHKNHPSIVSWSLGNESGYGANHAAIAGWIRQYDNTRLVQYENNDPGSLGSDIKCTMYPTVETLLDMIANNEDRRPIVLVEYAYQIANTTGGFNQFSELLEKYEIFQGGFVWDWQDKCLPAVSDSGETYFGFGGDFNEDVLDYACPYYMCANGVALPNLTPKPCAYEMKEGQSPILIEAVDIKNGLLEISNRFHDIMLEEIELSYIIEHRGNKISEGLLKEMQIDKSYFYDVQKALGGYALKFLRNNNSDIFSFNTGKIATLNDETYITVVAKTKKQYNWANAGHTICSKQFMILGRVSKISEHDSSGTLKVKQKNGEIAVKGTNFTAKINDDGNIVSYIKDKTEYITCLGVPNVFRARSGMHLESKWWGEQQGEWQSIEPGKLTIKPLKMDLIMNNGTAVINVLTELSGETGRIINKKIYTVYSDGSINLNVEMDIDDAFKSVPRVGFNMILPTGFDKLSWYGRGLSESYCDRKAASPIGQYSCAVEDTHFPFIPVSHNGGHADTQKVSFSNASGNSIIVSGANFYFTAHHNSEEEYWNALHEHELIRHGETYVSIDGAQTGIGGDMAWSSMLNEKHLVKAGSYNFTVDISFK